MKKILLLTALALGALAVSAQSVGGGRSSGGTEVSKGWNTIYLQYNNVGCSHEKINWERTIGWKPKESMHGFTLGFNHAFNITPSIPLYVETGLGLQAAFYSDSRTEYDQWDDDDQLDTEIKGHLLSAKIPVNILYQFKIPSTDIAIEPLIGIDCRINVLGKATEKETHYGYNTKVQEQETNIFDTKDMKGAGISKAASYFQIGWHVGANFAYKQISLGFQYGQDFNKCLDLYNLKYYCPLNFRH